MRIVMATLQGGDDDEGLSSAISKLGIMSDTFGKDDMQLEEEYARALGVGTSMSAQEALDKLEKELLSSVRDLSGDLGRWQM